MITKGLRLNPLMLSDSKSDTSASVRMFIEMFIQSECSSKYLHDQNVLEVRMFIRMFIWSVSS